MKKRLFAAVLAMSMLITLLPTTAFAEDSETVTPDLIIKDVDDLCAFADAVNSGGTFAGMTVKLNASIDLASKNWTPIGNDTNYFMGTFDGGNNTISNLTIDITSEGNVFAGLFGGIKKATVKNLTMENVNIDVVGAKVRAGAIVGIAYCNENRTDATNNFENITVDGCTINAEATSSSAMVGGIVGYCYPANMKGIAVSNLVINGKAASNSVEAAAMAGYVCGQNISNGAGTRAPMTVEGFDLDNIEINVTAYSALTGSYAGDTYYGYITLENGEIDDLKITVNAHEAFVGGLVGYFHRSDNGHTVNNVNITGVDFDVTTDYLGETRVGGVVGTSQSPNTKYTDVSVSGKIVERCSDGENPVNYHAKVGGFVARTNEYAQQTYTNCVADVDVTGSHVAGGFVGNHNSTVSYVNCEAEGDVTANIAGGFAGRLTSSVYTSAVTFDGCSASGDVTGTNVAGGFIGSTVDHGWAAWEVGKGTPYAKAITLVDCEATGDVTSGPDYCAGVIGETGLADGITLTLNNVTYAVEPPITPTEALTKVHVTATLSTDIDGKELVVGVPTEFTFSTIANNDAGTMVIGNSNFSDAAAIEKLEYYEVSNGTWYDLSGDFGPSTGFPMADATSKFRVTFKTAGNYSFTASMKKVDGGTTLCDTTANFSVREYEHPSKLTTDIGEKTFIAGGDWVEFTFSTIANDDAGIMVIGGSDFGTEYEDKIAALEYKAGDTWLDMKGQNFGSDVGFPMADATSTFRVKFTADAAGSYTFTAAMKKVDGGEVLCSIEVPFTVSYPPVDDSEDDYTPPAPSTTPSIEEAEGGDVTVSDNKPQAGEDVTITATPDEGYKVDDIIITDSKGNPIEVINNGDGTFSFVQPAGKVNIKVTFAEKSPCEDFADIDTEAWYHEAVDFVLANDIMNGIGDDKFDPSGLFSRAMFAKILHNMENNPDAASYGFDDVEPGVWYTEAIDWAASEDIIGGYGNDSFGTLDNITREQVAVILYRYAAYKGYNVDVQGDLAAYSDGNNVSAWAVNAVEWAIGAGIMQGNAGAFNPLGTATRAEVAKTIFNFFELIVNAE